MTGHLDPASLPGTVNDHEARIKNLELLLGRGDPLVREIELAFSFPTSLITGTEGARYPVRRPLTVINFAVTMDETSTNESTEWTVYRNGDAAGVIEVPISSPIWTGEFLMPGSVGDVIQPVITDGSNGREAWLYLYARR